MLAWRNSCELYKALTRCRGGGDTWLSSLFNPGRSAPWAKSLPCHRKTSTKDGDHHEDLYLLGAPMLPSDVPEGKSLAWWWRTPQEEEGPAWDTADSVNILSPGLLFMAGAVKDAPKPCYQDPNQEKDSPHCSRWTHCWIPTAQRGGPRCHRASQANIPTHAFPRYPDLLSKENQTLSDSTLIDHRATSHHFFLLGWC